MEPTSYRTTPIEGVSRRQAWMRERQPRLLVIWDRYDLSFELSEPEAYRSDVPNAEVHVLDAGYFGARHRGGPDRRAHPGFPEAGRVGERRREP
jgi:hypothetical protein